MQKIITKISKASICQFENFFHFISLNESFSSSYSNKEKLELVANTVKNNSIKLIDIIHYNSPPSIIPIKYYDKSIKAKYLETNSKISRSIGEDISFDKKITVVYSKNENLSQILNYDEIKIYHTNHFTKLYNYLIGQLNNYEGFSFFINLSDTSFEVIIFKNNKFVFFNSFNINNKNEFLYYTFFLLKNYHGSTTSDKIIFLGKYDRFDEFYDLVSKYSKIDFIEENINSLVSYNSQYFSIFK